MHLPTYRQQQRANQSPLTCDGKYRRLQCKTCRYWHDGASSFVMCAVHPLGMLEDCPDRVGLV